MFERGTRIPGYYQAQDTGSRLEKNIKFRDLKIKVSAYPGFPIILTCVAKHNGH